MFPQIDILGYKIGSYALFAVIGCIICGLVLCHLLKKHGLMMEDGIFFLLIVIAGVMVGGHLLYAITNFKYIPSLFEKVEFELWLKRLMYIFGGSVFYGGLFGGLLAGKIATMILHLDLSLWTDLMAPIIPLFHGIARVGCFFAGCCYGIESKFGFLTNSNAFVPSINGVTRFPVQLLEAVCNLVLAAIMFSLLYKRETNKKLQGNLIYIYFISYGVIRFCDEFLRGDLVRGFVGVLSTSQFISILSVSISTFLLIRALRKAKVEQNNG